MARGKIMILDTTLLTSARGHDTVWIITRTFSVRSIRGPGEHIMRKIIHLSDLHLGHRKDKAWNPEEKLKRICTRIRERWKPDECVIVITGDLVEDATKDRNYEKATNIFHDEEYLGEYTLLIVPGNHDYGTGNDLGGSDYVEGFKKTFFRNQSHEPEWDSPEFYPKKDLVGEGEDMIAFIGLDSMEGEVNDGSLRGADGKFGGAQLLRLAARLEEVKHCKHIVLYFHHHAYPCTWRWLPVFHGLKDRNDLGSVIEKYHGENPNHGIDLMLYGHEHDYRKDELWGIERCYDAGTSTRKGGFEDFIRKLLTLSMKKSKIRVFDLPTGECTEYDWLR
jgi:3',5'-cyclic AMP phosphodiesterase CpdA